MTREQYLSLVWAIPGWALMSAVFVSSGRVALIGLFFAAICLCSSAFMHGRAMDQFREKSQKEPTP